MRTTQQLLSDGWRALTKGLGLADALRYRILFQPGAGDYTRERKALFRGKSLDEIAEALRERRTGRRAPKRRKRR